MKIRTTLVASVATMGFALMTAQSAFAQASAPAAAPMADRSASAPMTDKAAQPAGAMASGVAEKKPAKAGAQSGPTPSAPK